MVERLFLLIQRHRGNPDALLPLTAKLLLLGFPRLLFLRKFDAFPVDVPFKLVDFDEVGKRGVLFLAVDLELDLQAQNVIRVRFKLLDQIIEVLDAAFTVLFAIVSFRRLGFG